MQAKRVNFVETYALITFDLTMTFRRKEWVVDRKTRIRT